MVPGFRGSNNVAKFLLKQLNALKIKPSASSFTLRSKIFEKGARSSIQEQDPSYNTT